MKKVELEISGITNSETHTNSYAIVLGEVGGNRKLPIVIGAMEAQAIAVALENIVPSRPLTHDLFKNFFITFDIDLKEVLINNLLEGVFFSQLVCEKSGEVIEIDSRTSDALALAVRFKCRIFTYDNIMDQAGIVLEETSSNKPVQAKKEERKDNPFASKSLDELNEMLDNALNDEDYEKAAKLRDEIKKKSNT